MGCCEEVTLFCEPGTRLLGQEERRNKLLNTMVPLLTIAVLVTCVVGLAVTLPRLRFHLGASERDSAAQNLVVDSEEESELADADLREATAMERIQQMVSTVQKQMSGLATAEDHQVEVSTEEAVTEDLLEYSDELEALLDNVGEDPADPNAVAFLLPLRGHGGSLGISYGSRLKLALEEAAEAAMTQNSTEDLQPPPAVMDSSHYFPSTILVRDTQGDPDVARKLTQHFYEIHGTTRYFGYLTDEEALTVAHWARAKAPGARFVTPTATTTYLESAKNVARVQPSARLLATAVGDLLATVHSQRPLVVARASLHIDSFLSLLHAVGLRPAKVFHYYETTNKEDLAERINHHYVLTSTPILLLGDYESWEVVKAADSLFSAVWILPFQTQLNDHMRTNQSELLTFMYRAYDDSPGSFLKEELLLSPSESIVSASKSLLTGGQRTWRGAYVVTAYVPVNSMSASVRLVGATDGWLPLMQYDITRKGIKRRLYQEVLVTRDLLKPLVSGKGCSVVLRYLEELTGAKVVSEVSVHSNLPTLLVPAERGAHLHVDCARHHADLRCSAPSGAWAPVTCRGALQGRHKFQTECGKEVGITVAASQGCSAARGLVCRGGGSLGCLFSGLCSTLTQPPPPYECAGIQLDTLY
ncbi:uncharacterized protein [Panulirus ornatus]|uniref:uncharacterized protein n=1 Tax=Panulirus ornatus TaxID=150431 RepID=UPI003A86A6AD